MANGTVLRSPKIEDDFLRITGQADAHHLARHLAAARPHVFAWEDGRGTTRYARSLHAEGGICLAYGRRNRDGLDAPQSDTRASKDFMLEVPGRNALDLLPTLHEHAAARTMQAPRRDLAITAKFDLDAAPHVYAWWSDLIRDEFDRPAHRIGPDAAAWHRTTLQTHEKQSSAPRFAILYDKHGQDAASYPEPGTLRFEFRYQPEKAAQKRALFLAPADAVVRSWRFSRKALEILSNKHQLKSFAWSEPLQAADLETMTLRLLQSYGPTLARGLTSGNAAAYLHTLALAALLQASGPRKAEDMALEHVGHTRPAGPTCEPVQPGEPMRRAEADAGDC